MQIKTRLQTLCVIVSILSGLAACGKRTRSTEDLNAKGVKSTSPEETEKLQSQIRDQYEALAKLSNEKSSLETRANSLDAEITEIKAKLAATGLSDQEKAELQKKIEELNRVDLQIADLTAKNADLKKQLDDMIAENSKLQKKLEASKAPVTPQRGAGVQTGGEAIVTFFSLRYADPNKIKNDCLDIPNNSSADDVQLISYPCKADASNQHFTFVDTIKPFFAIKIQSSGKCLAASSNAEDAAVVQKTCAESESQTWDLTAPSATDIFIRNKASGKCMKIQSDGKISLGNCEYNSTPFNKTPVN
ncbi:MAG: ricin-type beta-trefoil lectin domain protein [Proteobacteria bacterium]|nr:ricin-type beta-trefoil lectin domain protein [Pseudomonadota bacterium]